MGQIEGKVAAILDRTTIIINRGALDGVSKGLKFYIYTELGPFNDPDTGEDLGTIKKVWGRVHVSNVADRLCMARTEEHILPGIESFLGAFSGRKVQIELPIDESEIASWSDRVSVGTRVISEHLPQAVIAAPNQVEALPASSTDSEEPASAKDKSDSEPPRE